MIGIIISFLAGVISGIFTGLTPGIHTNLVVTTIISIPIFSKLPINYFLVFITATSITHTFLNFIPSIFLGAPDSDTALGILPGHKFLLKGLGHHAVKLTLIGSTIAIISLIFVIPVFFFILPKFYPIIEKMMGFILIWASIFLIFNNSSKLEEENSKIILSLLIFFLAGFLGLATFNLNLINPMLPLLTGLFGTSTIINSIKTNSTMPPQITKKIAIDKKQLIKPTIATILISPICSLLPGLGSSQAAIISSSIFKKLNQEQFLILLGSINTLVMSTSFLTLYLFKKSRTGTASAISQITTLSQTNLIIILTTIIITSILAIPITLILSKIIAKEIHKFNYKKISVAILIFLIAITIYFSGILGLLVLIISTIVGLTCVEFNVKRGILMSSILIPTIIFYLPF